jgi:hypothetical protein
MRYDVIREYTGPPVVKTFWDGTLSFGAIDSTPRQHRVNK